MSGEKSVVRENFCSVAFARCVCILCVTAHAVMFAEQFFSMLLLLLVLVLLVLLYQPGVTDMWFMDWEGRAVLEESGAPIGLCFIVEGE